MKNLALKNSSNFINEIIKHQNKLADRGLFISPAIFKKLYSEASELGSFKICWVNKPHLYNAHIVIFENNSLNLIKITVRCANEAFCEDKQKRYAILKIEKDNKTICFNPKSKEQFYLNDIIENKLEII